MATIGQTRATLDDLYRTEGKAELIGGRIVEFMPTGFRPHRIAGRIFMSLHAYETVHRTGFAINDGLGFTIAELPSGRESFSPDAAFWIGTPPQDDVRFVEGAPTFAVEVRSANDYDAAAELELAAKRADYFLAGALAIWDVDPLAETVTLYRTDASTQPVVFPRGVLADAEPAVPGWRMSVDEVFAA